MFNKRVYPDEIANFLINNTEAATETDRDALTDVLYNLLAIAENERNSEAYRTLYRAMEELTSTVFEIRCTYYNKATGDKKELWHRGASVNEVFESYVADGEAHDLAKYTPRTITSVESFTII